MRTIGLSTGPLERITWVFSLCTLLALGYLATPSPSFTWQEGPSCSVEDCEVEGEGEPECGPVFASVECGPFQYQLYCGCGEPEVGAICGCQ